MATFPSLRTAAKYAGVSYQAIRVWAKEYEIGELQDGKWVIHKERLDRVIAINDQISELRQSLKS